MVSRERLRHRAAFFRAIRSFFEQQNFLEVDTPVRHPVLIPEANIIPISTEDHFLQTSPEICMKRILASGCEKIFQICPCFRKEERGFLHLEEFSMLEWYRLDCDYLQLMTDCKELVDFVTHDFSSKFPSLIQLDLSDEWERITVHEAFEKFSQISVESALESDSFNEILVECIEPYLGQTVPTILYDYPTELASLAKRKESNSSVAERFELYIKGVEIANGFSELTDPIEQGKRFEKELEQILLEGGNSGGMPLKFIDELQCINHAAGIALGMDRLLMVLLGKKQIQDVVPFHPGTM